MENIDLGYASPDSRIMLYITYGYGDFSGDDDIAVKAGSKYGFTRGVFGNVGFFREAAGLRPVFHSPIIAITAALAEFQHQRQMIAVALLPIGHPSNRPPGSVTHKLRSRSAGFENQAG